jgi:AbrB family looped-hinge helix DNA binding protein
MKEVVATITSKGQVTIPAEVRRHLGVSTSDKIVFVLRADGSVEIKVPRYSTVDSLAGAAGTLSKPLSWHEIREIAREERLVKKYTGRN